MEPERPVRESPFLSTPSARRATLGVVDAATMVKISIHALREEGDTRKQSKALSDTYFYPRPPRGGRPYHNDSELSILDFYPRPPRGGRRG